MFFVLDYNYRSSGSSRDLENQCRSWNNYNIFIITVYIIMIYFIPYYNYRPSGSSRDLEDQCRSWNNYNNIIITII